MIVFRVRYTSNQTMPHVYCRLFVASDGGIYTSLATMSMQPAEFDQFRKQFNAEFIEDGGGQK